MIFQVWPYLLGVFPITSTKSEKEKILSELSIKYKNFTQAWKRVENINRKQKLRTDCEESSPPLSIISPSPSFYDNDDIPSQGEAENDTSPASLQNEINKLAAQENGVFDFIHPSYELDDEGQMFIKELDTIDKDIPRCDRDYW